MKLSWVDEFLSDWLLSGKSQKVGNSHEYYLIILFNNCPDPQLIDIKKWLTTTNSKEVCRKRAQSTRAFGVWCEIVELGDTVLVA